MWKKFLLWILSICLGTFVLYYTSTRAIESEREFFHSLFLKSNRDVGILVARQISAELRQVRKRMEGFSRYILKEDFNQKKVRDYFRYNFESDEVIAGVRLHKKPKDFRKLINDSENKFIDYHNLRFPMTRDSFTLGQSLSLQKVYRNKKDYFSEPFSSRDKFYISWIQTLSERRKKIFPGILEAKVSLETLFNFASGVVRSKGGHILLVDKQGRVMLPRNGGWSLTSKDLFRIKRAKQGGFERFVGGERELLSFCSLKLVDRITLPDWYVIVVEDPKELEKVTNRLRWNMLTIMAVGVLALMVLARLIIFR